ncbi:MAG: peptidylprolyl isomerase [Alphaproteobacteria bacterium]|jgi:peptidyl-prolyl cis-trans isomerase C
MPYFRHASAVVAVAAILAAAPAVIAQAPDPVVATVNGANILRSDIEAARAQLPEQYRNLPMDQAFQPILNQLIRTKLLAQKARDAKLQESETHKRSVALIEDRLLEQAYLQQAIEKRLTDKALRDRYEVAVKSYPASEEVRARHILVNTEAEAVAVIKEISGGADFAKLAAEKSIGPSKTRGGDLDYFGRGQMVKSFEDAAFALDKGAVTDKPVQSQFGWHVIKVEDKRQSKPPSFEDAREQISQEMSQDAAGEVVKELTEGAIIQRFGLDGAAPRLKRLPPAQ